MISVLPIAAPTITVANLSFIVPGLVPGLPRLPCPRLFRNQGM